jgi:signal transduction histidine kinase
MREKLQESYSQLVSEQQEKLRLERELRHTERLASVGRLAAGLAHEIGTPLNIIGGRAEYLLRRPRTPEEMRENLTVMRSQIDRITAIVRQLLEFSRRKEPVFRSVDFPALLRDVQRLLEHQIREKAIRVEIETAHLPPIKADPDLLQQVFINLYSNSIHALDRGGLIKIRADIAGHDTLVSDQTNGARRLRVWFEDNGAGIAAEHLGHVFDPFFTTKDVGEGTGLGLSVAYGIIKDHGGAIKVESEPGGYTRFVIDLPVELPLSIGEQDELHEYRA